ncbi:hypothetical protein CEXT_536201 [Caerostris extrusa]|uniref:Uncharacterized protein n=1 Tax=Caerostris extrusa TaxID=172846 RepID=A0AAV4QTJ0_CAEEX|nr:hypothetical protein CEXT_536201 [Caerostris extrusa]
MGKSKGTCYQKAAKLNSKSQRTGKTDSSESSEDSLSIICFPPSLLGRRKTSNAGNGNHELQSSHPEQYGNRKKGLLSFLISVLFRDWKGDEDVHGEKRCSKRGQVVCHAAVALTDHSNEWERVCKGDLIYLFERITD